MYIYREHTLVELLDHHGRLGQTKLLFDKQSTELQANIARVKSKMSAAGQMKTRSLAEAKAKISQIQVRFTTRCVSLLIHCDSQRM